MISFVYLPIAIAAAPLVYVSPSYDRYLELYARKRADNIEC